MSKLFRNLNLRTKLILSVLSVSLIVLFTIVIFTHVWYQAEMEKYHIERLRVTSQSYAGAIERMLEKAMADTLPNALRPIERKIAEMTPYTDSYTQVINDKGVIVFHPDTAKVDSTLTLDGNTDISVDIKAGKEKVVVRQVNGKKFYDTFYPLHVAESMNPWALCIVVPESSLMADVYNIIRSSSLLFFPGIAILLIIVIMVVNTIIRPINGANRVLSQLSLGHISKAEQLPVKNNDEIGKMSQALNALTTGLRDMLAFAEHIGKRDYSVEYHLLSEQDELGAEMIAMRNNLTGSAQKEEEFKKGEERRNWVNHGLAEFSEVLRNNSHDMDTLAYQMVSGLVKYLDANQGGFFVVNDEDPSHTYLELMASYAYERRRYLKKQVEAGDGLVGICYQEGETIYMNDVPDKYISITSGIGQANPRVIVIVPLKINDVVHGIVEIASFKEIKPYKIDFLEKIGAVTASTISTVKGNQHTAKLLEQSQIQAQRLSEQEEEMRQNIEEMQATQEEMYRKNLESERAHKELSEAMSRMEEIQEKLKNEKYEVQSVMNAVDHIFIRITYGTDMTLLDINDAALDFHEATRDQMVGIKLTAKMNPADVPAFEANWAKVLAGETFTGEGIRKSNGVDKRVWYMYSPIKDASEKVHKVLMLGRFIEEA
ncbi:MAG: GAF domain-containing protein [Bacteroidales bacterium]|jgi:methyl-accepting chemotaxis protein|nr:GAF domain-containing protein [Bacteroidales bacterium]